MARKKKITVKQQRYIDCYDGDRRKAAQDAGITHQYARELHSKACYSHVLKAIQNREKKWSDKKIKSREERQEFWSGLMDTAEKDSDKLKASELLGRSEADFTDRIEKNINIKHDLTDRLRKALEKKKIHHG